jgi:hypothetical protein
MMGFAVELQNILNEENDLNEDIRQLHCRMPKFFNATAKYH